MPGTVQMKAREMNLFETLATGSSETSESTESKT